MSVQAVFLDRDGVINREIDLLHRPEQLELLPGAARAIRRLNDAGILTIVVTNQPVVARALCTEEEVRRIHARLADLLRDAAGARLDAVFYCPHHPETHHEDGNPAYRGPCRCRKPATGMLEDAATRFGLDLRHCVLVGDSTRDIKAGADAGCRTFLVGTGYAGGDAKYDVTPDHRVADLGEVVSRLLVDRLARPRPRKPEA